MIISKTFYANKARSNPDRKYDDAARKVIQKEISREMKSLKKQYPGKKVSYHVVEQRHNNSTWFVNFAIE